jgi:vacuolar-type H+-ATPase subunit H
MIRKINTLAAIAALTLAGGAYAQGEGVPGIDVDTNASAKMMGVDKDANRKISKAEAKSNKDLAKAFDSLDANKDGSLDEAEFAKFEGGVNKDELSNPEKKGVDDSTPDNKDKLGPGR